MVAAIKRLLVGRAIRTEAAAHERLTKKQRLPFSRLMRFHRRPTLPKKYFSCWL